MTDLSVFDRFLAVDHWAAQVSRLVRLDQRHKVRRHATGGRQADLAFERASRSDSDARLAEIVFALFEHEDFVEIEVIIEADLQARMS